MIYQDTLSSNIFIPPLSITVLDQKILPFGGGVEPVAISFVYRLQLV